MSKSNIKKSQHKKKKKMSEVEERIMYGYMYIYYDGSFCHLMYMNVFLSNYQRFQVFSL